MAAELAFLEPVAEPPDAIEVGRILDAWGIQGWFKVLPYSASPEALFSSKRWYLKPPEPPKSNRGVMVKAQAFSGTQLLKIRIAKEHSDGIVAQADGVSDRHAAELLKGARIFIPRSSFPTPAENEYYWVDLIGCAVENLQNEEIGTVKDLMTTGPQTVIVCERAVAAGKKLETLIPFVDVYVSSVDVSGKRIVVDWQLDD